MIVDLGVEIYIVLKFQPHRERADNGVECCVLVEGSSG